MLDCHSQQHAPEPLCFVRHWKLLLWFTEQSPLLCDQIYCLALKSTAQAEVCPFLQDQPTKHTPAMSTALFLSPPSCPGRSFKKVVLPSKQLGTAWETSQSQIYTPNRQLHLVIKGVDLGAARPEIRNQHHIIAM